VSGVDLNWSTGVCSSRRGARSRSGVGAAGVGRRRCTGAGRGFGAGAALVLVCGRTATVGAAVVATAGAGLRAWRGHDPRNAGDGSRGSDPAMRCSTLALASATASAATATAGTASTVAPASIGFPVRGRTEFGARGASYSEAMGQAPSFSCGEGDFGLQVRRRAPAKRAAF
jgi:hypothetical protein